MKFIPILFSTPMVIANMEKRKNQTRRLRNLEIINENPDEYEFVRLQDYADGSYRAIFDDGNTLGSAICPYGKPGDILWVRETWAGTMNINSMENWPDRPHLRTDDSESEIPHSVIIWRADGYWQWCDDDGFSTEKSYWKPSIHMPKMASRLFLKVKSIRVERLQEISEADAISEGIEKFGDGWRSYEIIHSGKHKGSSHPHSAVPNKMARTSYMELWEFINGPGSWNANPWVWVVDYEQIEKPIGWPDNLSDAEPIATPDSVKEMEVDEDKTSDHG